MTHTSHHLSLLLLIMIPGGPEWSVKYSSTHICALEGSSVTMSCSYTYPSYLTVTEAFWTNQDSVNSDLSENVIYKQRVTVDSKNKHRECSLNMIQLTKADEQYQYYCRITTNVDKHKFTGVTGISLQITDLQIVSTSKESVTEGDNVTLTCKTTCTLTGSPSFTWSKDGRPVEKKQIINNQLQLHPVSREDEGNYTCAVGGHEGLPSPPYRLHVMYPPRNTRVESDPSGEITEGTKVTLTCMSEADPPVHTYTWIKKSGAVELESGKEKTLTLSNISSEDSGEYLCRAANRIGQQDSPAVSVQVLCEYHCKST
ncbi:B-cell receptor CD22-like [Alosa pseudoharengus]|uniref:B-cell receptor CD22-like n=1 Tax=Alosa pseudoharengus TaxID=34774 RepID=UPI003F893943